MGKGAVNLLLLTGVTITGLATADIVLRTIAPQYLDFQSVTDYSDLMKNPVASYRVSKKSP